MLQSEIFIAELKQEAANTRKLIERIPFEHFNWKPHEKSMALGRLITHVVELPDWAVMIVQNDELNLATAAYKPTITTNTEELIALFETKQHAAIAALTNVSDEALDKKWTLRHNDHIIFSLPKNAVIRNMVLNHIVHHRAQLTVYLRLLDIPVPGFYGPSADER